LGNTALVDILITKLESQLLLAVLPECHERRVLEYRVSACDNAIQRLRGLSVLGSLRDKPHARSLKALQF
jgi:hypothetical protein